MDAELKKKWIRALRSGKYKQGRYRLYSNFTDSYCCLGLLCDLLDRTKWQKDEWDYWAWGNREDALPETVRRKVKLSPKQQGSLIRMNDQEGKTFSEIADYIKEHL